MPRNILIKRAGLAGILALYFIGGHVQVAIAQEISFESPKSVSSHRIEKPTIDRDGKKYRLDWCYSWEKNCGKAAADAYCKANGFNRADSFEMDPFAGNPKNPTAIISDKQVFCPGTHVGHRCDSFRFIACAGGD